MVFSYIAVKLKLAQLPDKRRLEANCPSRGHVRYWFYYVYVYCVVSL